MRRPRAAFTVFLLAITLATGCTGDRTERPATPQPTLAAESEECRELDELVARTRRGYVPGRSAEISPIPREPNYIGKAELPVHTGPWDYLAEVPLVIYGPGVVGRRGTVERPTTLADLAAMTADLIGHRTFSAPDGRPDPELPGSGEPPRVVVTLVWDGAGWNTLEAHPGRWPTLKRLSEAGVSYTKATIGSTPSNTPPIHTTIGTGAFPRTHGIPHVKMRTASGAYVDPFEGDDASEVKVNTLGDDYDRARDELPHIGVVATVNWHLGMIGHGAELTGADRDIAVLLNDQGLTYGNNDFYDIPPVADPVALDEATTDLDRTDGAADGDWNEDDLSDPALRYATPAFTDYQQGVLERTSRPRASAPMTFPISCT